MNSLQNDINSSNNNGDNDVFLSSLIYQQSSYNSLLNWNDFKTDNYLKWCEMNLLSNENDEINHNNKSLAKKRLFDIFQLQDQKSNTNENIINTTNEKVETRNSTQTYYQRLFTTTHTSSSTTLSIKDLNNLENFLMNNLTTNLGISIDQFKVLVKWSDSLLKRIAKEPSPTI
ncbi:hypothetical protein PACTADRAFT_74812 [Pachysolen tannophilus NRRL Y-2460]|uniref:Uncharacterized protein n=1 Tax=Pachysolen tannophilus NRRL Y-2460 TaxID=669874 RepID=A0A1E4TZW3_PACTA|nr:hypothetical protein PACTADRAFT_74812 [Pachysolen tannophilus NRRL Y-2460]